MRSATNTINRRKEYIPDAWEQGHTDAIAESLNRQIKDIIRKCLGFMGFAAFGHSCSLVLGHKREPDKPIPLFTRHSRKEDAG